MTGLLYFLEKVLSKKKCLAPTQLAVEVYFYKDELAVTKGELSA
jgi:hypothetical protein